MNPITTFRGTYFFLSNFYPAEVYFQGLYYPSSEHAYQAAKTVLVEERRVIQSAKTGAEAKKLGKQVTVQPGWDALKLPVMERLVRDKFFRHPELGRALLSTGDASIIEENYWGDTFWGICKGKGRNELGRILMDVRTLLQELAMYLA